MAAVSSSMKKMTLMFILIVMRFLARCAAQAVRLPDYNSSSSVKGYATITIQHMSHRRYNHIVAGLQEMQGRAGTSAMAETDNELAATSTPVDSGFYLGGNDYYARLTVGDSPGRELYFHMDTGSDVTWIQCEPCKKCYKQLDDEPVYDPRAESTTVRDVSGDSRLCAALGPSRTSRAGSRRCTYEIDYADDSTTAGKLITETLTLDSGQSFSDIPIGCSNLNEGYFSPSAGLLGLSRGFLAFHSQLRQHSVDLPHTFSYCLPRMYSSDTSTLTFGAPIDPRHTVFTPLFVNPNPVFRTYFYVQITHIKVGIEHLLLPSRLFDIHPRTHKGGAIIDTGSTSCQLPEIAYTALRDTLKNAISANAPQLELAEPSSAALDLDTCYRLKVGVPEGERFAGVPSVIFGFAGGAELEVPPQIAFVFINKTKKPRNRFCLSFSIIQAEDGITILGNLLQQRVRVTLDMENERVGFTPNAC
ncbi:hypothetical protein L7F22_026687 [Adiantum nelumboides]|nr:hypothetical protein [Adiantum nelumboides]